MREVFLDFLLMTIFGMLMIAVINTGILIRRIQFFGD